MKAKRKKLFTAMILVIVLSACNLPSAGTETAGATVTPTTTTVPAETATPEVENTATATTTPTETPIVPTLTVSIPPEISMINNSNCRLGPSTNYVIIDQIANSEVLDVIGRNDENTWWEIVNKTGRECWIFHENARPNRDFSDVPIGEAPPLPGKPLSFTVTNQSCQPGPRIFTVTFTWASGGGEDYYKMYRDGGQIIELNASKTSFKDLKAPFNINIVYELFAINENGMSEPATQIVPACK
ncbi:MAG: SH3 domain-containing protein [Chloroflexi bacterium]|nr:SH3 domain-containing protein [Chloroflexota bacterium]